MRYEFVSGPEVGRVADGLIRAAADASDSLTFLAVVTIGGERAWVCDEAIVASDESEIGIATISETGEAGRGMPEVVGVFVLEAHRGRGVGLELLRRAIARCRERGFPRVGASAVSKGGMRLIERLSPEDRAYLDVRDHSQFSIF